MVKPLELFGGTERSWGSPQEVAGQPFDSSNGEAMPAICRILLSWGELGFWGIKKPGSGRVVQRHVPSRAGSASVPPIVRSDWVWQRWPGDP